MKTKLGFLVNNFGPSQFNYRLITGLNEALSKRNDLDAICFFENLVPPCLNTNFACMQSAELYGFDGIAVANDFFGAKKLISCPFPAKKFFYCWDLDWLRFKAKTFAELREVYGSSELTLLARGVDHKVIIEQAWNRSVAAVVDDLDITQLLNVLEN